MQTTLLRTFLALLFFPVATSTLPAQGPPLDPCEVGYWSSPFPHDVSEWANDLNYGDIRPPSSSQKARFNAVHMALIGAPGPYRGSVLVWDTAADLNDPAPPGRPWLQRWSVLTIGTSDVTFTNRVIDSIPNADIFCAGHAWDSEGNLFVAGGTSDYGPPFVGSEYESGHAIFAGSEGGSMMQSSQGGRSWIAMMDREGWRRCRRCWRSMPRAV